MNGEHMARGILAIGVGSVVGIAALSYHWWKNRLSLTVWRIAERFAGLLVIVAIILLFAFFAGPDVYQRAIYPLPAPPTANAIAAAVVKAIGTSGAPLANSKPQDLSAIQSERDQARRQLADAKTRINSLEGQMTALQQRMMIGTSPAPISNPVPPKKFYSQKQKDQLADMLQSLVSIIDSQGQSLTSQEVPAGISSAMLMSRWMPQTTPEERAQTTIKAVTEIQKSARSYSVALAAFMQSYNFYADELSFIDLASLQSLYNAMAEIANGVLSTMTDPIEANIKKYPNDHQLDNVLFSLVSGQLGTMSREFASLDTTTQDVKNRISILRKSLEQ